MPDSYRWQEWAPPGVRKGGIVYSLLGDIGLATRIAKAAAHCHVEIHNLDRAEAVLVHFKARLPILVILDWDSKEAEAYSLLKDLTKNADFKGIPVIGFVSSAKEALIGEAQRAGCDRVYSKSEFIKDLNNIFMRYAT